MDKYFDENKFSLEHKIDTLHGIDKEECALHTIDNNYKGFDYKGNNNICYTFSSNTFDTNLKNDILDIDKYKIKTYLKTKNLIDLDKNENQNNPYNYFEKNNNEEFIIKDIINKDIVSTEKECMYKCMFNNKDNCKSIIYLEEPKECNFYNKKNMKVYNDNNLKYDIYTIKNNINNQNIYGVLKNNIEYNYNQPKMDISANWTKIRDVPALYKCNGLNSTNPFCTSPFNPDDIENNDFQHYTNCLNNNNFDNINDRNLYYTKECKNKFGNEYIFDDNNNNLDNIIKCDNGGKRVRCKLDMYSNNIMENFENCVSKNCINYNNPKIPYEEYLNENKVKHNKYFFILLLIFFVLLFMYL
jgi:hypothetical protein